MWNRHSLKVPVVKAHAGRVVCDGLAIEPIVIEIVRAENWKTGCVAVRLQTGPSNGWRLPFGKQSENGKAGARSCR
jgi:hypothetical protein